MTDRIDDGAASNLLQAIQERNPHERPELVAIALQAYVDEDGRFGKIPRRILASVIPERPHSGCSSSKAARIVDELQKAGWLENRQTKNNGVPGIWYLNIKRLDLIDDAMRMTQATRAVNDLRRLYPDLKLRQLIAELLRRDEP